MSLPVSAASLQRHERFHSRHVATDRDLVVYLPPGYVEGEHRSYPVLYLHDGQNLFEAEKAFIRGEHWRVAETATTLIEANQIEPLIIVGIDNTGAGRIDDYTHTHDRRRGGGKAPEYGRFILEEVKPFIDAIYRTREAHCGMGGSSLGGLVTLYLGLRYPHVLTRLAVMSPSVWWDRRSILRDVRQCRCEIHPRIWLDMGTAESRGGGSARRVLEDTRLLKTGLLKAGWVEGRNLHYEEVEGGTHSERAWGDRFGRVLQWLYPARIG